MVDGNGLPDHWLCPGGITLTCNMPARTHARKHARTHMHTHTHRQAGRQAARKVEAMFVYSHRVPGIWLNYCTIRLDIIQYGVHCGLAGITML